MKDFTPSANAVINPLIDFGYLFLTENTPIPA